MLQNDTPNTGKWRLNSGRTSQHDPHVDEPRCTEHLATWKLIRLHVLHQLHNDDIQDIFLRHGTDGMKERCEPGPEGQTSCHGFCLESTCFAEWTAHSRIPDCLCSFAEQCTLNRSPSGAPIGIAVFFIYTHFTARHELVEQDSLRIILRAHHTA